MFPTLVYGPNKEVLLSRLASVIEGAFFVPITGQNNITIPAAVGVNQGQSPVIVANAPTDSWLLLTECVGSMTLGATERRLLMQIFENSTYQRLLMNRPVLFDHVFGTVGNPFLMEEHGAPLLLQPQQNLTWQFFNPDTAGTATVNVRFGALRFRLASLNDMQVKRLMMNELHKSRQVTPYWLVCDNDISGTKNCPGITLAASATETEIYFTNKNDVTLILGAVMFTAIPAAGVAGDTQELFTFEIFDPRTQKSLQTQPVSSNCGAGTSSFPYILRTPLFVGPNQYLKMKLNSLNTGSTTDVFVTFFGTAIYTGGKSGDHDWLGNYKEDPLPNPLKSIQSLENIHA